MSSKTFDVSNMAKYHWLLHPTKNAQNIQNWLRNWLFYIFKSSVSAIYVIFYKALLVRFKEHASEVYEYKP